MLYWHYFHFTLFVMPLGLGTAFFGKSDAKLFLIVYTIVGFYFSAKMARDGPRWREMARDGPTWPEMARDHPRSPEVARDHPRSPEMARGGPRWPEITRGFP